MKTKEKKTAFSRTLRLVFANDAATSIEYAVMLSLIAGAIIASVGVLATRMKSSFNASGDVINPALSP
ncbi:MAG: Flp family type IVb pilin [Planctomycetes bacterium]|nr:Flp family type IVb pilin [Planctomycetota bacterium]